MNFLAHIYLSFENESILIGNFIGDFVKGKAMEEYPQEVQNGISLHREIDHYTDTHPIVTETKKKLRPTFHHYAPVISDVFYDHFLSSLWSDYHKEPLAEYTNWAYDVLKNNKKMIPPKAWHMLSYMSRDNWLYNYQFIEGIDRTLTGMSRRTPFESKMEQASDYLVKDYEAYKTDFISFFPELIAHCQQKLNTFE